MKYKEKNGKIVLKDFNPGEALKIAMYVEEEGARFYRELTGRTKDKQIRNELQFLWNEEESHRSNIEKLLRKWDGGDTVDVKDADKLAVLADKGIFGPIKKLRTEDILCNNAEALRFGAVVKKRMISFFHSLLEETKDAESRKVLEEIIAQEEQHLDKLKLLLAY
jgi:rubrerythrin